LLMTIYILPCASEAIPFRSSRGADLSAAS
jgi:hypothetical protein